MENVTARLHALQWPHACVRVTLGGRGFAEQRLCEGESRHLFADAVRPFEAVGVVHLARAKSAFEGADGSALAEHGGKRHSLSLPHPRCRGPALRSSMRWRIVHSRRNRVGRRSRRHAAVPRLSRAPPSGGRAAPFCGPAADVFAGDRGVDEIDEDAAPSGRHRSYLPRGVARPPGLVLVHGIHRLAVDEPRLVRFARALAESGVAVLTPEVRELADYRVDARSIDTIGAAAHALRSKLSRKVGVMGMSFAGGCLCLPPCDSRFEADIGMVIAVGAHDDAARVARFFCDEPHRTAQRHHGVADGASLWRARVRLCPRRSVFPRRGPGESRARRWHRGSRKSATERARPRARRARRRESF